MISDKEIYVISGKDLKKFVHVLSDLKEVAIQYAEMNEQDIKETELVYDNFINSLLHSQIFKNLSILDLQDEFSFYELIKSTGIVLNGRN